MGTAYLLILGDRDAIAWVLRDLYATRGRPLVTSCQAALQSYLDVASRP